MQQSPAPPRCAFVWGGGTGASSVASRPEFRTIQVCPKDFPASRGSLGVPHRLLSWEVSP